MGLIDSVKSMQAQGISDQEIVNALRQQGISDAQISEAITQSRIKTAVDSNNEGLPPLPPLDSGSVSGTDSGGAFGGYEGMQPSMLTSGEQPMQQGMQGQQPYDPSGMNAPSPGQSASSYQSQMPSVASGPVSSYQGYETAGGDSFETGPFQSYPTYEAGTSSDVMAEITEQVVSEKLSFIQDKLERAINFRTIAETKLNSIDERLHRIERIIDRLQLSLLQKVGEFVGDVKDTKRELAENRKSFKALLAKAGKDHSSKKRR